jgi:hypothetical protein
MAGELWYPSQAKEMRRARKRLRKHNGLTSGRGRKEEQQGRRGQLICLADINEGRSTEIFVWYVE